jgi:aspartyl protease family protein
MFRLFLFVVAVGVVIGLVLPSSQPSRADAAVTAPGSPREVVLTRGSSGHFFTSAKVNGKPGIKFMVDTGAYTVALTTDDARKIGLAVDPSKFEIIGEGASGAVRGQKVMLESVDVDGIRMEQVPGVVLENSTLSLLGQSFLESVDQVSIAGDYLSLKDSG